MALSVEDRHAHLEELVRCMLSLEPKVDRTVMLTYCVVQQKEVDFLHNENQLLEGYLQRVRP